MNIWTILVLCCSLTLTSAYAENAFSAGSKTSNARKVYLADQLMQLGNESKDPIFILAAASLYRDSVVGNRSEEGRQTLQLIVDHAIEMSPNDGRIAEIGSDIVNIKKRNIISSVKEKHGKLASGEKLAFIAEFEGGVDASASLVIDPKVASLWGSRNDIGVDFFVRDEDGRDICSVQSTSVPYNCSWTPSRQGKFRIELRNSGKVATPYALYFE